MMHGMRKEDNPHDMNRIMSNSYYKNTRKVSRKKRGRKIQIKKSSFFRKNYSQGCIKINKRYNQ